MNRQNIMIQMTGIDKLHRVSEAAKVLRVSATDDVPAMEGGSQAHQSWRQDCLPEWELEMLSRT